MVSCALSPNWCGLCRIDEEDQDHLLLHCSYTKELWSRVLKELSVEWVFPRKAHDMFLVEPGLHSGRKSRCLWFFIVHCLFWTIWLERKNRIFNDLVESSDEIWEKLKFRVASWMKKLPEFNHLVITDVVRD